MKPEWVLLVYKNKYAEMFKTNTDTEAETYNMQSGTIEDIQQEIKSRMEKQLEKLKQDNQAIAFDVAIPKDIAAQYNLSGRKENGGGMIVMTEPATSGPAIMGAP
jgi:DNA-directed RNA polymerase beta' subunit